MLDLVHQWCAQALARARVSGEPRFRSEIIDMSAIHVDPREADIALKDGSTVHVRPIRPDDEARLLDLLQSLSPDARVLRFFSAGVDLAARARQDSQVDADQTYGLIATTGLDDRAVFITSEGGRFPTPGQTTTSLMAGGLIMMTKVVAKELSRSRIRVNTVAVTLVEDTPSWDQFKSGESARMSVYGKIQKRAPFGLAKPADIAEVAAFLVSDSAAFVTGATISPTGGMTYS